MSDVEPPDGQMTDEDLADRIKASHACVVITIMPKGEDGRDGRVQLLSRNFTEANIPTLLRVLADKMTNTTTREATTHVAEIYSVACCPICAEELMFPPVCLSNPLEGYANVCTCGAFLLLRASSGGSALLEPMTDGEFLRLPLVMQSRMVIERAKRQRERAGNVQ